jgi:hypothetical protein
MRKDDHIAREHLDRILADQPDVAMTPGENVIGDQVLCGREDLGLQLLGRRRFYDPGLRRLDRVEEGAIEADHSQKVGERVHLRGS